MLILLAHWAIHYRVLATLQLGKQQLEELEDAFQNSAEVVSTRNELLSTQIKILEESNRRAAAIELGGQLRGELTRAIQDHAYSTVVKQCCDIFVALGTVSIQEERYDDPREFLHRAIDGEPSLVPGGRAHLTVDKAQRAAYALLAETALRDAGVEAVGDMLETALSNFNDSGIGHLIAASILTHCSSLELPAIDDTTLKTWQKRLRELRESAKERGVLEQELNEVFATDETRTDDKGL